LTAAILILSTSMAVGIGKTLNPYTTHCFRLSMHLLAVHIKRMCTLPGNHHVEVGAYFRTRIQCDMQKCESVKTGNV